MTALRDVPVSGPATERATLVLAPNAGPMTYDGTNTWLLREPGSSQAALVDPGPEDERHFATIGEALARERLTITHVLVTHRHPDHASGAHAFADQVDAPVLAYHDELADEVIRGGEVLMVGGLRIEVVATPGHSGDSLSFHLPADHATLTGDTLVGRTTPAIFHPDGRVRDLLESLTMLRATLPERGRPVFLPGHGPVIADPAAVVGVALETRLRRLEQIRAAVESGDDTAERLASRFYGDQDPRIRFAVLANLRAHLAYLEEVDGRVAPSGA